MIGAVMTPEVAVRALRLAARGATLKAAASALDLGPSTLHAWASRNHVTFADGRKVPGLKRPGFRNTEAFREAARRNAAKASKVSAERKRFLHQLSEAERAAYKNIQRHGLVDRAEILRAIGRPDLAGAP